MIATDRRKQLLADAERLVADLGRFKTPGSGEAVDPSRIAELSRFLRISGKLDEFDRFLTLLPSSFHARLSRSAPPQLQEVVRLVRPLAKRPTTAEELIYLFEWTRRLLATVERGTSPHGPPDRGGPNRGRPSSGGRNGPRPQR